MALYEKLDLIDKEVVASYVAGGSKRILVLLWMTCARCSGLQQEDGSFAGDKWLEIDTRFSYCALSCLSILGCLDKIDVKKATGLAAFILLLTDCCNSQIL